MEVEREFLEKILILLEDLHGDDEIPWFTDPQHERTFAITSELRSLLYERKEK